ncbi:MAG: radical SAM protein [Clostridia bacterium]|nr:radical SAM protein [Clostridia bacterium]
MLCGRECGVDRVSGARGFCRCGNTASLARASLHAWEEPIISGTRGSGTVFFSGCSLGCVFCQNRGISKSPVGEYATAEDISRVMLSLEMQGAHNINFVTPTHFAPTVAEAISIARKSGLTVPIVYNTGGYDSLAALALLDGLVDIYLADLKYVRSKSATELSCAENYPEVAKAAIAEMVRQQPTPHIDGGIMTRGVIVRVLLLPSHTAEAKLAVKYLYETYGNSIYISLMSQYTPIEGVPPSIARRVTRAEYGELVEYASSLGITRAFVQDKESASDAYIPEFNTTNL